MSGDFRPRKYVDGEPQPQEAQSTRRLEERKDFTPRPVVKDVKKSATRRAEDSASTEAKMHPAKEAPATAGKVASPEPPSTGRIERPAVPKPSRDTESPRTSSSRDSQKTQPKQ